jgi:hypothetical protein
MSFDRDNLLRTAFDAYLLQFNGSELEPVEKYLTYDFDDIDSRRWRPLGDMMVKDELREITNNLNHWHELLQCWQVWNNVIQPYGTDEAWELRREFLEALAHHCLFMPSSIRDTFTFVATNSLHQVRLMANKGYRDYLEGDPKNPSERPKHLTRRQKEKRLADLISIWSEAPDFMASLRKIDDEAYRNVTSDYRNRNSHSIGPRLGIGITRAVVRSVEQATMLSKQSDGTYSPTPIPNKMSVIYGFGGTEPLDMEQARAANLDQYRRARECYAKYRSLLTVGLASMPLAQS